MPELRPEDELGQAVRALARRLDQLGVEPPNSPAATLAIFRAIGEWFDMSIPGEPAAPAWARDAVRRACTVELEDGMTMEIRTIRGLARAGQLDSFETWARLNARHFEHGPEGTWTCPTCGKLFPDDYGPVECDACGTGLVRHWKVEP